MWKPISAVLLSLWAFDAHAQSRTIYRCVVDGQTIFSDQPCAPDAKVYEPAASITLYEAQAVREVSTQTRSTAKTRKPADASIAHSQARHQEECERIAASLKAVRSKYRAGYSAKEGERLRAREDQLEAKRKQQRCR